MRVTNLGWKLLGLAVVALACAFIFSRLFVTAGGDLGLTDSYEVDVPLPTAISLVPGSEVRSAGVEVGSVEEVGNRGATAVVRISLDTDHAPVYRDARVRVRTKTLVGENYLDLAPGTEAAGAVPDGGALARANAEPTTQLDQIFSALNRPARRSLRRALDGLGAGLGGQGDELNALVAGTGAAFEQGEPVLTLLAERRVQAAGLVADTGELAASLAARTESLRTLVRSGRATAEAVASRDAELGELLDELPGALRSARLAAAALGDLADRGRPVVADLDAGAAALEPVVGRLGSAARRGRELLASLDRFTPAGIPLARDLGRFARTARPLVQALTPAVRQLDPMLEYVAPYYREIGAIAGNLGSGVGSTDAIGHLGRVHALVDEATYAGFTGEQRDAVEALLDIGALGELHTKGTNNYPRPGEIGDPKPFEGSYPRLYPRDWRAP